jgi:hypothetical protein
MPSSAAAAIAALVRIGSPLAVLALAGALAGAEEAGKDGQDAPTRKIVPVTVAPERAAQTLKEARAALDKSDWLKAGGLLEGVLDIDPRKLSEADRRSAAAGLVTCCLQLEDGAGAGRALGKRASVAVDEREKRLLLTAAEALRDSNSNRIGAKTVRTYEEALAAAPEWKAQSLLAQAKKMSANARQFSVAGYLDRIVKNCTDRLAEADGYVPNFSGSHRREVLEPMIANLMQGARKAVDLCTAERDYLNTHRYLSLYGGDKTKQWAGRVKAYMGARQEAEDALQNLKAFAPKSGLGDLYNENEVNDVLNKLDDLKYYPGRGPRGRLRILPRPTGGGPSS